MRTRLIPITLATLLLGTSLAGTVEARDDRQHWRAPSSSHGHHYDRGRSSHHRGGHQHQQRHRHQHRPPAHVVQHGPHHAPRHHGHHRPAHPIHNGRHRYHAYRYPPPHHYVRPHGYQQAYWSAGYHLPSAYYAPRYYVDYRPYRLAPPPYGHHWVRVDNDVFLVALTTGLIVEAMHGLFH